MTRQEFLILAQRCEDECRAAPKAYRIRTLLWTWLAGMALPALLAALILVVVAFLSVFVGMVYLGGGLSVVPKWIGIGSLPAFLFGYIATRLLVGKSDPPDGVPIVLKDFPVLEAAIREAATKLDAPMPDQVVLTTDYNAFAAEIPSRLPLGGVKRYLGLGLPLLDSISYHDACAVIAHEMAHLSRRHGYSRRLILRARLVWLRALQAAEKSGAEAGLLGDLFLDLQPGIEARSLAIAREQEYEADHLSAKVYTPRLVAETLLRTEVLAPLWSKAAYAQVELAIRREPEPPVELFDRIYAAKENELDPAETEAAIARAFTEPFRPDAEHPTVLMRIQALCMPMTAKHYTDRMSAPREDRATEKLFGALALEARCAVGALWRSEILHHWQVAHDEARDAAAELAEVQRKPESQRTSRDWWLILADRIRTEGGDGFEAELRGLVAAAWDLEDPLLELIRLLGRRGDAECLDLVASRINERNSPRAIHFAAEVVLDHLGKQGRANAFAEWRPWFAELLETAERRIDEEFQVDPSYPFLQSHSLRPVQAKRLARQLHDRGATRAWLAQRINDNPADPPLFLLIVDRKRSLLEWNGDDAWDEFLSACLEDIAFPHRLLILPASSDWEHFIAAADAIPRSRLLPR